jgi:hypothetical protein
MSADLGPNTHCFHNARSGLNPARTSRKELRLLPGHKVSTLRDNGGVTPFASSR